MTSSHLIYRVDATHNAIKVMAHLLRELHPADSQNGGEGLQLRAVNELLDRLLAVTVNTTHGAALVVATKAYRSFMAKAAQDIDRPPAALPCCSPEIDHEAIAWHSKSCPDKPQHPYRVPREY